MPALGTTIPERFNPLTKPFWTAFKKDTGIKIPYHLFKEIIWETNLKMMQAAADDDAGIKLPERLGHMVVTRYKSKKIPVDWKNSIRLKRFVPLLNMHSFGYIHHIKWFTAGTKFAYNYIYMFKPCRDFKRRVAANVQTGQQYHTWENTDFWSQTKLDRRYEKFFNQQKDKSSSWE